MVKKVNVKLVGDYAGHSIGANKSVNMTFKARYDELVHYIQLLQMLNNDISVTATVEETELKLGTFRLKQVQVADDGEGTIKINSMADFVESNAINSLVGEKTIKLSFTADIDVEDSDEDAEEEEADDDDDDDWDDDDDDDWDE